MNINDLELTFEIDMTKEKLRELLTQVENAEKVALPGQILRIKIHHAFCLTFRNVYKVSSSKSVSFEKEDKYDNKHEQLDLKKPLFS